MNSGLGSALGFTLKRFTAVIIAILSLATVLVSNVSAAPITVLIGDDDGFGGTQGATSSAGDVYSNAAAEALGTIAPGNYANTAALDVRVATPFTPYSFTFDFAYDVSSFGSIGSAIVEIQSGSLARRVSANTGFGFADVSATIGGSSLALGDFLTVNTGSASSALEETVKISSFDVSSLISAGTAGTLTLTIDGSSLSNPIDLFVMDFARLTVEDNAIPEPGALALFGLGLAGLGFARRRNR